MVHYKKIGYHGHQFEDWRHLFQTIQCEWTTITCNFFNMA